MGRKRPLAEVEVKVLDRDCLKRALELVQDPTRGGEVDDCYPHLRGKLTRVRRLKTRHFCQHDVMRTNDVGPTSVQSLLSQLRRSVSEHDWSSVARIIDFMLNLNGKLMPVIWKACFLVLFNHPNSSAQTLNDFLMVCLGLTTEQAMSDFLTCLLTLPTDLDNVVKFRQEETYFDSDIISLL